MPIQSTNGIQLYSQPEYYKGPLLSHSHKIQESYSVVLPFLVSTLHKLHTLQQAKKGIDQPSYSGVVSTWTASAQQTRGTATQTRYPARHGAEPQDAPHLHNVAGAADANKMETEPLCLSVLIY